MNSPTARNGRTKPRVYTPISTKAQPLVPADAAMIRTLARAGPTQGVHAKLKVKPRRRAVTGDMARVSSLKGSLLSRPRKADEPNTPSWYSPKRMMSTPPTRTNSTWLSLKNVPSAETPSPRIKKAAPTPITKNRVFIITRLRS